MFDPFYAEAERLGLAIFVHALHPLIGERLVGPKPLAAFIGFPTDVGLAAASFITGGTLAKFPNLRIGFSHGGGTLAALLPRLQNGWAIAPEFRAAFASPTQSARRMFYDNVVFDPDLLRHLIATFGETQIVAGSDYPYVAGQRFPGRPFDALGLPEDTLDLLRAGNARRFLGLAAA
jgi:aminocarboxymuconate-semialdehyde decarboxylase